MLEPALDQFRELLGAEYVVTESSGLERYRWCTIPVTREIPAALRPASVDELQQLVRIAKVHRIALYPISTGNNWGYGSALPAQDRSVVVDLGRMNRIVEVNAELAYAVVEPGVTQRQLYEYLTERRLPLWLNPTGGGPNCSILGNTLERGYGIGPNGDHFLAQCGMEVVLADGSILRTGFGHHAGAKAAHVYKWGIGPYLDGLFTQSNFGIVTKIGVWLAPEPDRFEACYFTLGSDEQLPPVIDALRHLLFCGIFRGPVNLLHRNRVLIMLGRYPWTEMSGRTPLADTVAERLASQRRIGMWNGVGALYGGTAQVAGAKRTIREVLKGKVDRITFLSDRKFRFLRRFPKLSSQLLKLNVPELLRTLESSYGLLKGVPSEVALALAYWRNRTGQNPAADINPARDKCGLMWFAPVIPMTRADVSAFRRIIEPICASYGFDACMTLTAVNERCFDCTLPLLYNRDDPDEIRKATACYSELLQSCEAEGYLPYRLGLQSMRQETMRDDSFWHMIQTLKNALDPDGILAPGRYAR